MRLGTIIIIYNIIVSLSLMFTKKFRLFDASNISQENLRAVEKLLSTHGSSFSEKTAKRASVACAPLAAWVLANVKYANVLQKIAPLEKEQQTLSQSVLL